MRLHAKRLVVLGATVFVLWFVYCFLSLILFEDPANVIYQETLNSVHAIKAQSNNIQQQLKSIKSNIDFKEKFKEHALPLLRLPDQELWSRRNPVVENTCEFSEQAADENISHRMHKVHRGLLYDNPNGGSWKQGWEITYEDSSFNSDKLIVYVVPHSHHDAGWIWTLQEYFDTKSHAIINNIVNALSSDRRRKFVWAEVVFLAMWWEKSSQDMRAKMEQIVASGQLEICTGGWVMTEEASSHYYPMLDQLIEGAQWIQKHLPGYIPRTGWSIDPFGHSPTMTYLLRRSGIQAMVMNRFHYAIKKYLARNKAVDFLWRQEWDTGSDTQVFAHVLPFYHYDVPHSCGPDPSICCQFDFPRMMGSYGSCPWGIQPQAINSDNVAARSAILLSQFKKMAQLFRTNTIIVPLGDDFRYTSDSEIELVYSNFQNLMNHINLDASLKAEVKFGTLKDYFETVAQRKGTDTESHPVDHPTLTGDFFVYADRDDHYWSGYYSVRPFHKRLDRILFTHQRAAEIFYNLMRAHHPVEALSELHKSMYSKLINARQTMGLFQHHDAITGTSRTHVMQDYARRILTSLQQLEKVLSDCSILLLNQGHGVEPAPNPPIIKLASLPRSEKEPAVDETMLITNNSYIILINSLPQERRSIAQVYVSNPEVEVEDVSLGVVVDSESALHWQNGEVSSNRFLLSFRVVVPPLGIRVYRVKSTSNPRQHTYADIIVYNSINLPGSSMPMFRIKRGGGATFQINNRYLGAHFESTWGLLQEINMKDLGASVKLNLLMASYGTTNKQDRSGAYLFMPDGGSQTYLPESNAQVVITNGSLYSEVISFLKNVVLVVKTFDIEGEQGRAIHIDNIVDLRPVDNNLELVMRVSTDLRHPEGVFYTDLNGFQMSKRKHHPNLPLQAEVYPVASLLYFEDTTRRLSIITDHPCGAAMFSPGEVEMFIDRKLFQDDNRGLGQTIVDNVPTRVSYRLLVEPIHGPNPNDEHILSYPSQPVHVLRNQVLHPLLHLQFVGSVSPPGSISEFRGLQMPFPCDIDLVTLRSFDGQNEGMPSDHTLLILHRPAWTCRINQDSECHPSGGRVRLAELLIPLSVSDVRERSFNLLQTSDAGTDVDLPHMEIKALSMKIRRNN